MADIFTRIRDDVSGAPASDRLRETVRLVSIALSDESEFRRQHETSAANPLIDSASAETAQGEVARAALKEQRLQAGLKLLDDKLKETTAAEHQAELVTAYDAAKTRRDDLVAEFRKVWPKHVKPLVAMLNRMRHLDAELGGIATPADFDKLDTAESMLNAAPQYRDPNYTGTVVMRTPSMLDFVRLPAIIGTDAPAWNFEADRKVAEAEAEQRMRAAAYEDRPRVASHLPTSIAQFKSAVPGRNEWVA